MRTKRSISVPIILATLTVSLSIALLVGWVLIIVLSEDVASETWLLVIGIVSLVFIMAVSVIFGVSLVREMNEVTRQTSFIDSVTHELKSPLASIRLCLETLDRAGVSEAQRQQLRQMMYDDVDRLTIFIDDILNSSRLAYEKGAHAIASISAEELVRDCATVIERRHRLPAGTIATQVDDGLVLTTDVIALETVLKNLLDNAVKYSPGIPRPGEVSVRVLRGPGSVDIEVVDRGLGIPKKHLKQVFDRFYRVPAEAVRERHGSGLGLYVVHSLVRALGGKVWATSEGAGRGTTFRVQLDSTRVLRSDA
ncbi:MAG: HAMP domain-containing sensor histidine kinase [Planctomycetota bacterium]